MRIVVDNDIWGADTLFAKLGDVVALSAAEIAAATIRHVDALIVADE